MLIFPKRGVELRINHGETQVTGKDYAEASQVKLSDVCASARYTRSTLDKMAKANPDRLKLLCDGQLMKDLGVGAEELNAYVKLKRSIEGK